MLHLYFVILSTEEIIWTSMKLDYENPYNVFNGGATL